MHHSCAHRQDNRSFFASNAGRLSSRTRMTTHLPRTELPSTLAERAKAYGRSAQAPATRRAYAADLADFTPGAPAAAAPPDAGRRVSTIRRRIAAIADLHSRHELASPTTSKLFREVLRGISRERGTAPHKKAALTVEGLRAILDELANEGLRGIRDRALLLVGFHGALRRSELVALDVEDLQFEPEGLILRIRASTTDQEGQGAEIGLPRHPDATIEPVRAREYWLEAAVITTRPVFRSLSLRGELQATRLDGRDVARILQRAARRVGVCSDLAAHSLRAGFITAAAKAGVAIDRIAAVSRHKSVPVLLGYVRRARVLEDAPQLAIR